ncbi:MAG TPA: hypothetical protein VFW68_14775 [Rhodocyclaceae bacterium]|nr:hypothetical protein [Rhodocyclaceae bacterium]
MATSRKETRPETGGALAAGARLLEIYGELARQEKHLLGKLLNGSAPCQWSHYPEDDAFDPARGFQWFYHSHSPEDRPGAAEHGHVHLFARRKLWSRRLKSARETAFSRLADGDQALANTRHLLCIGFDAKGIPNTLFTVNSWVTGDLMLSAETTADILSRLSLNTGHPEVDGVIECVVRLCQSEIKSLLEARDQRLFGWKFPGVLGDQKLELLSELPIDMDGKLAALTDVSR